MQTTQQTPRRLYNADYRLHLDDPDTPADEPVIANANGDNTSEEDPVTPEEKTWKKRYGDLRSHTHTLTERINSLEAQLQAAQKKEIKIPSTEDELNAFATKYPDVYRHIRSIAMAEILSEKENLELETKQVKENLSKTQRELGLARILKAHPDFHELNMSEEFHEWANAQPKQIQDWLFESDDPQLCIKAIDFYKSETNYAKKKKAPEKRPSGADLHVPTKGTVDLGDGQKRIWKDSEVRKMHPREYEKYEDEIDQARREGRYDESA